ncbi:hypothetical protein DDT91_17130 [Algoriphagus sp. AK58]|nr:hypothetical protein [Algoriphagus sp. AK58]
MGTKPKSSVFGFYLFFSLEKIKLPKQVEESVTSRIGKSFSKNTSNCPANNTLKVRETYKGPEIQIPQRQDSFDQKKPNNPPPKRPASRRKNGNTSEFGIKKIRIPKSIARI